MTGAGGRTVSIFTVRPRSCGRLSGDPIALSGPQQPAGSGEGRETVGRHAVCRRATVERRRILVQSGNRSGLRRRRHARRRRLSERRSLQARRLLSLCASAARVRAADHRSRRRNAKAGRRHQSSSPTRRPPIAWCCGSATSRSSTYSTPTNTPTIRRPIFSTGRWSMPAPSTMPAMAGVTPTALQPNGIRAALTVRGGVFDLSATPAGGNSPSGVALDPTFNQFQMVGEIEERHQLWGQPGKIKVTGFLSHGRAARFPTRSPLPRSPAARRHRAVRNLHQPHRRQPQSGAASHRDDRRLRPRRLGRRQDRAMGFHRHRPDDLGRCVDQRQAVGPAGRHDRHRRRHQQHFTACTRPFSTPAASAS